MAEIRILQPHPHKVYIFIELLKNSHLLLSDISTIWENTDGCTDKYRFATEIYLLSMLAHSYNVIID